MQRNSSIRTVGLSTGAALAVPYVLVMFAGLLLVGIPHTGSRQAALLGIEWNTVAGFEIGLVGVVLVGFAVAAVVVPVYNAISRRVGGRAKDQIRPVPTGNSLARSWAVLLLAALLVLIPAVLLGLRALAARPAPGAAPVADGANVAGLGGRAQPVNLGPAINTAFRDTEPSFTADGQTMYFNCHSGDICVSHLAGTWEAGNWTPPERLGPSINTEYEEVEPVINAAGDKLYFTSIRPGGRLKGIPFLSPFVSVIRVVNTIATARLGRSFFGGLGLADVYVSYMVDGEWSEPLNLNEAAGEPAINTAFHDHCLLFSADGNEAFWTSTRPGGLGGNDIWTSRRVSGTWSEPENLGPNVNSSGAEHAPTPTPDAGSLYVTTTRPGGFGEEDIYITARGADGEWGPLVNLGPLVNGTGDDRCPAWTPDLKIFLFDSVREGGFGARDIWWVYFEGVSGYPLGATSAATGP